MVLGLPEDVLTTEVLARQQALFETFLEGFVALPFNFPGTGSFTCSSAMLKAAAYSAFCWLHWSIGNGRVCILMKEQPVSEPDGRANCASL